jgi:hypothetical protein
VKITVFRDVTYCRGLLVIDLSKERSAFIFGVKQSRRIVFTLLGRLDEGTTPSETPRITRPTSQSHFPQDKSSATPLWENLQSSSDRTTFNVDFLRLALSIGKAGGRSGEVCGRDPVFIVKQAKWAPGPV